MIIPKFCSLKLQENSSLWDSIEAEQQIALAEFKTANPTLSRRELYAQELELRNIAYSKYGNWLSSDFVNHKELIRAQNIITQKLDRLFARKDN